MTDGVVVVVAAAVVVDVVVVSQGSLVALIAVEEEESQTGLWELMWVLLVLMELLLLMIMGAGVELVETQIGGVVEVEVDFRHRRHLESTLIEPEVEVVIVMEMHYQWVHSDGVVDFGSARYPIRHSLVDSFGGQCVDLGVLHPHG